MKFENFEKGVRGLAEKFEKNNPGASIRVHSTSSGLEINYITREKLRNDWVERMLVEYRSGYEYWSKVILSDPKRKIVVAHFEDNWDYGRTTVALCSPTDTFDENVGLAVAFAKFRGYDIPDFV